MNPLNTHTTSGDHTHNGQGCNGIGVSNIPLDGNGETLSEGERVYSFDFDGSKCFGILHKNKEYPNVSEWYISYDDGQECAVLEISFVFKSK